MSHLRSAAGMEDCHTNIARTVLTFRLSNVAIKYGISIIWCDGRNIKVNVNVNVYVYSLISHRV